MVTNTETTTSMVEQHNSLFMGIQRAETREDISNLYQGVKNFTDAYSAIDPDSANKIYDQYSHKLNEMLETNEELYQKFRQQFDELRNTQYSFAGEKDDRQAIDSKVLQLLAQMPKRVTQASESQLRNNLIKEINSGIIGSKAVLQLLNYPAYSDLLTPDLKTRALNNSKTKEQLKFEAKKEEAEKELSSIMAKAYMRGFHLRNIAKRIDRNSKISNWNEINSK